MPNPNHNMTREGYLGTFFPEAGSVSEVADFPALEWPLGKQSLPRLIYKPGRPEYLVRETYEDAKMSGRFLHQDVHPSGLSGSSTRPANPAEIFGLIHAAERDGIDLEVVEQLRQDAAIELHEMLQAVGFSAINLDPQVIRS